MAATSLSRPKVKDHDATWDPSPSTGKARHQHRTTGAQKLRSVLPLARMAPACGADQTPTRRGLRRSELQWPALSRTSHLRRSHLLVIHFHGSCFRVRRAKNTSSSGEPRAVTMQQSVIGFLIMPRLNTDRPVLRGRSLTPKSMPIYAHLGKSPLRGRGVKNAICAKVHQRATAAAQVTWCRAQLIVPARGIFELS